MSGSEALEVSTPALAQTKPWRVRQMRIASLGAQHLDGLIEHHLDRAWIPLGFDRQLARAVAGVDLGERYHRALGLGDGLVRDRHELAVAQASARQRRGDERPQIISGPHLGQAANGTGGEGRHGARTVSRCL